MEDNTGFKKKPRSFEPYAVLQAVDDRDRSRQTAKGGGAKPSGKPKSASSSSAMKVVGGRGSRQTPEVADHISRRLKAVYEDVVNQQVPNRFLELLNRLDSDSDQ